MTEGTIRARYRKGFTQTELMEPGKVEEYRLHLKLQLSTVQPEPEHGRGRGHGYSHVRRAVIAVNPKHGTFEPNKIPWTKVWGHLITSG